MTYSAQQTSWTSCRARKTFWRGPETVVAWPQPVEDHYDEDAAIARAVEHYVEIAHHEAGHVIANLFCGQPLYKVIVRRDGTGVCYSTPPQEKYDNRDNSAAFGDLCRRWKNHGVSNTDAQLVAVEAVILASGRAAQILYNANADSEAWAADFEKLHGLADLLHEHRGRALAWLDEQIDFAERIVARHRADIHNVAVALAEKGEMSGAEVRGVIDRSSVRHRAMELT